MIAIEDEYCEPYAQPKMGIFRRDMEISGKKKSIGIKVWRSLTIDDRKGRIMSVIECITFDLGFSCVILHPQRPHRVVWVTSITEEPGPTNATEPNRTPEGSNT